MSVAKKPHWMDGLKGISAGLGLLTAGFIASLPPETRADFLRALNEAYCSQCGNARELCKCGEKV